MKNSKFSESQIIKALKENQQGRSVGDISRELGIDKSTFYYWRKKLSQRPALTEPKTAVGFTPVRREVAICWEEN